MQTYLKCELCGACIKNTRGMPSHLTQRHKLSTLEYYRQFPQTRKITTAILFKRKEWLTKKIPTNTQLADIEKIILDEHVLSSAEIVCISNFIEYSLEDIYERFAKYKKIPNKSANSLENYIIRFGELNGPRLYAQKNAIAAPSLENYIRRYGETIGMEKYKKHNQTKSGALKEYIRRYGEHDGTVAYNNFCARNRGNLSLERKIEMHGKKDGKRHYNKMIEKRKTIGTLAGYISRHGEVVGTEIFNKVITALHHGASITGFIEKYGEIDGPIKHKQSKQNTTLEKYIKLYGDTEGKRKHKKLRKRLARAVTLPGYIERYGEIDGPLLYEKWKHSCAIKFGGWSKISQDLFWKIYDKIHNDFINITFATNDNGIRNDTINNEHRIFYDDKKYFKLDFYIKDIEFVIEFDGSFWHSDAKHKYGYTGVEANVRDTILQNKFPKMKIIRVKEVDYYNDSIKVIDLCVKEIYEHERTYSTYNHR